MAIKDLNINASLQHEDIIPIFDSANGRTRAVLAKTIKEYSENKEAYTSGSVEDGKLYLTDAQGNKELIGPVGDSGSVPSPIIDNAIYTYDQQNGWVDTGVRAVDGSIQTSAGSVSVGNHKLSSLGENFGFTNMRTSITYVPPWQELSETGNEGPVRVDFITDAKDVVRNADTSETITNPSWAVTAQTEDEALFRISITDAVSAIDDVYLVGHISGENEFRVRLGNLQAGQNDFILQYPLFIKQVDTVTVSLASKHGDVVVKGKGGIPAYQVRIRDYKETTDNSQLRVEEADGTDAVDGVVTIKTKGILLTDEGSGVIELEVTHPHSSIGAHFVGIYNDLQALKDAIGSPANNYQAIVITPSEKYYHGVAGAWVELAPVGNLHPNYLGVYDTLQDLEAAYPTPGDESMAIVGTAEKVFYLYINSAWEEIKGTDLPALTGRVSVLESDVSSLKGRMNTAEGHLQTLQALTTDHTDKITKNIDNINALEALGSTFTFNGKTAPTYDDNQHGNYLLVFRAMDATLNINAPEPTAGNQDGTILTIYNEDIDNAVRLTIDLDSGAHAVNIPPENFASYVYKHATDRWTTLESGYIPAARINIANFVKNSLKTDGLTHTFDDIQAEGFIKGVKVTGDDVTNFNDATWLHFVGAKIASSAKAGQAVITITSDVDPTSVVMHFQTIAERNQWSTDHGADYTKVIAAVDDDGNGFVGWYEWNGTQWDTYNGQGLIMSDSDGAIPKLIKTAVFGPGFTIQQAGDQEDAALITYQGAGDGSGAITLDDGTTNVAEISVLELKGAKVTRLPTDPGGSAHTAQVTAGLNIHMPTADGGEGSGLATEVEVMPPLSVFINPDQTGAEAVRLEIEHDAFEPMQAPSFLAYLTEPVDVVGKLPQGQELSAGSHHDGAVWFDDIVVDGGEYIESRRSDKSWGIQESDDLDPNVTGGMDYLIAARIHMKGTAPSSGFVRLYLYNKSVDPFEPTGYLQDKNGNPMVIQRDYRFGDELGVVDLIGIVTAKGLQEFSVHVVDSFTGDILELTDRTEGASGLMIQALKTDSKTGLGLLQFESDTMQNIEFNSHYLGPDRLTLQYYNHLDSPLTTYSAGSHESVIDGIFLRNRNGMKIGVTDGRTVINDDGNGLHLIDFQYGKVFSNEETRMLRGRQVRVTATTTTKQNAARLIVAKWTGAADAYTPDIIASWSNDNPTYSAGWVEVAWSELVENLLTEDNVKTIDITVPTDANNYAVFLTQLSPVMPFHLDVKELNVSVVTPFTGYSLRAPELVNEMHFINAKDHKSYAISTDKSGIWRYTINSTPAEGIPAPIGVYQKGRANIVLDPSVNTVPGSQRSTGEGALKFEDDGKASIFTAFTMYNETSSSSTVKVWWASVSTDGQTFTKFPDSEYTFVVPKGNIASRHAFRYEHEFKKNDRIALFYLADKADGAYISTKGGKNAVEVDIDFEVLQAQEESDLVTSTLTKSTTKDCRYQEFSGNSAQNIQIPDLDIPSGVFIHSVTVEKKTPTGFASETAEHAYNTSTQTLTVHVGGAAEGTIFIEFWSK